MGTQRHIIQKFQLDLQCSGEQGGQDLPFQYQEALQKEVLPALEEILDSYSSADELIRIDQLSIDLGNLKIGLPRKSLVQQMLAAIEQALKSNVGRKQKSKSVQRLPVAAAQLDQLIQFLGKGYWPEATKDLNLAKTIAQILEKTPKPFFHALQKAIEKYGSQLLKRLVLQLPEDCLELIFNKAIAWTPVKAIAPVKTTFFRHLPLTDRHTRQQLWQAIFQSVFSNNQEKAQVGIRLTPFLEQLCRKKPRLVSALKELKIKYPELRIHQALEVALKANPEQSQMKQQSAIKVGDQLVTKEQPEIEEDLNRGLLGENVGIILLHPFLKSFFTESELLNENGQFKNTTAAERGVGLLHFLATGEKSASEHQLVFQKLICNLPLNHTMDYQFSITEEEITESEKMMKAAIQYWDALGKSSVSGLQEGFLQRSGYVKRNEENLILNIDYKTMDILLDKIPWNISMIQLPWLNGLLTVNWRK